MFEELETIIGTAGDELNKAINIITTDKYSDARKLINDTTTAPYGANPKQWRKREKGMKFQLWATATIIKKLLNNSFQSIKHVFEYFTSAMS